MKKLFLFTLIFLLLTGCKEKTVAASHIDLEVALDSNYNTVSTSVFVDGQKIETVVLNNDNEIAGYAYREYNDNGQLVKESKFDSNKELQEMCLTEWTGNIASSVSCYLKDGTSYERVSSIIEDSKIIERTYKTETSYTIYYYDYDEEGRIAKTSNITYDLDGNPLFNCYSDYEYSGNKTIVYNYDEGEKAYTYKNIYIYDNYGRLSKLESYTEKDKLISSCRYSYHDNNLMKTFKFSDSKSTREEKYDSYGALTYLKDDYEGSTYKEK